MPRLSAEDLAVLGRYLYGPRWQSSLARELNVSRQLVVYWAGGKRPVSAGHTHRIAEIARARHDRRVASERSAYIAMSQGLSSSTARTLMLSMIANEVQARIQVIATLTGSIEKSVSQLSRLARDEILRGAGDGIDREGGATLDGLAGLPKPTRRQLGGVD